MKLRRIRSPFASIPLWGAVFLLAFAGPAQAAGESKGATITFGQADAILQELKAIRGLLERIQKQGLAAAPQRPARPTTAEVTIDGRPMLGEPDAPVTVVEFTDFQCPFCKRFITGTFPALKKDYIDTGKVRWVVRDLPLGFHKNARKAAQAAHCAGDQGKYWEMRETLFTNSSALEEDKLPGYAKASGLDVEAFQACLDSEEHLAHIDADIAAAGDVRVTGTPTFVVGPSTGEAVSGKVIVGAQALPVFRSIIDAALNKD